MGNIFEPIPHYYIACIVYNGIPACPGTAYTMYTGLLDMADGELVRLLHLRGVLHYSYW